MEANCSLAHGLGVIKIAIGLAVHGQVLHGQVDAVGACGEAGVGSGAGLVGQGFKGQSGGGRGRIGPAAGGYGPRGRVLFLQGRSGGRSAAALVGLDFALGLFLVTLTGSSG